MEVDNYIRCAIEKLEKNAENTEKSEDRSFCLR